MDRASTPLHPPLTPEPPSAPSSRPVWAREGRKLGRYRLGPSLGRGGMGEVFEAWDTLLNRLVAVKTLNAPVPNAIIRFMKEAQLQARVSHPNICRIYDVDVADNTPFIAMQRVEGPSLFGVAPDLTPRQAVEILTAVAHAMHAAHRVNLIHRDLKPSNILLEPAPGGGWIPYVADFGLAKDLGESGLTLGQGVMGTPSFMAPEQKRGDSGLVGPATDIYALGATLCAVLDLERGFRPLEETRAATGRKSGARPAWVGIPSQLRRILHRCLEERPGDRYPTAAALAEDFRRFLDGEPLLGDRGAWLRGARMFLRRHAVWAASLGITLALGTGFALWSARLSATSKRRTVLALHFAHDARDLENRIGIERLHPPHDLSPLLDGMTLGLARMQEDIASLGPEARGPGDLALGRGYLAMRFLESALRVLDEAWAADFRTPDVAYALCRTHCELYARIRDQEQTGDLPPAPDRAASHLQAARATYQAAEGVTWEPREFCLVRLLIFEGRASEALAEARRLQASHPLFYEALVEEANALEALGTGRLKAGDPVGAMALYRQAEAASMRARTVGRSDVTCYLAALDWRLHWLDQPGLAPAEALPVWREAEGLVDVVLAIRPRYTRAISAKVYVLLGRARAVRALGGDPGPVLDRAEAFIGSARPLPSVAWLTLRKRQQILKAREELGYPG